MIRILIAIWMMMCCADLTAQDDCLNTITPFQDQESLRYDVSYKLGPVWSTAGHVTFSVAAMERKGYKLWHFKGEGGTYEKFDWIYRVRDKYQSWTLQDSFEPITFVRQVSEGKTTIYNTYKFNPKRRIATVEYFNNTYDSEVQAGNDTFAYNPCNYDVITAIYYARSIDYSLYQVGDTIPMTLILDRTIEPTYVRYLGTEEITLPKKDVKIKCYKFKPMLIEGTIFTGGENMTVWVSADANRVPVYVESKILVGKIQAYLVEAKNLVEPVNYY